MLDTRQKAKYHRHCVSNFKAAFIKQNSSAGVWGVVFHIGGIRVYISTNGIWGPFLVNLG